MVKQSKIDYSVQLRSHLADQSCVIVVKNNGMNVVELSKLRSLLRECEASFKIVKNTIATISLSDTDHKDIVSNLVGPVGLAFSSEAVSLTKALVKFAKECEKVEVISGSMDGALISLKDIQSLSELDSLDDIRAKIVGALSSPASKIVRLINTLPTNITRIINLKHSN